MKRRASPYSLGSFNPVLAQPDPSLAGGCAYFAIFSFLTFLAPPPMAATSE